MNLTNVLLCLIAIESGGKVDAVNGDGVGILQIRPVFVEDVNRILGREQFDAADRYSRIKSLQMARIWFRHYEKPEWTLIDYALSFKMGVEGFKKARELDMITTAEHDYATQFVNLMEDAE